jgi:hypothetical protein
MPNVPDPEQEWERKMHVLTHNSAEIDDVGVWLDPEGADLSGAGVPRVILDKQKVPFRRRRQKRVC